MVCTTSGEAIVIRVLLESGAGGYRVHIRDTGVGISRDMFSRIFDPFVQAAQRAGSAGGVGLGLALAQQLTRMHDGSLSAHSDGPGKGSEFVLQLPAA